MKKIILFSLLLFISSCNCTHDLKVIVLEIQYHNISTADNALLVLTEKGNLNNRIDTNYISGISLDNDYKAELLVLNTNYDYLIYLNQSGRIDTISNFDVTEDRCGKPKSYSFNVNGTRQSNNKINFY